MQSKGKYDLRESRASTENKSHNGSCRKSASLLYASIHFYNDQEILLIKKVGHKYLHRLASLRASSPIWASEASLARTRERAANQRGTEERRALLSSAPRSRVFARLTSLAQIGELARRLSIGR